MNKLLGIIILGLLVSCGSNDVTPPLVFSGQVRNGDIASPTPAGDIKVKINYYGSGFNLLKVDSTLTDASGNYTFKIPDNKSMRKYHIKVKDEYYFQCNNIRPIINGFGLPKDIDFLRPNIDTIDVCVTGRIQLIITKSALTGKDTLSIYTKVIIGSFGLIVPPIKISGSKQLMDYYFVKNTSAVEYKFILKREDGEITSWSTEEEIQAQTTNRLEIGF